MQLYLIIHSFTHLNSLYALYAKHQTLMHFTHFTQFTRIEVFYTVFVFFTQGQNTLSNFTLRLSLYASFTRRLRKVNLLYTHFMHTLLYACLRTLRKAKTLNATLRTWQLADDLSTRANSGKGLTLAKD